MGLVKIKTCKELEGIAPYALGKSIEEIKNEYQLEIVRKMSDNENVYGCSSAVKAAITTNLENLNLYPDGTTSKLVQALGERYGLDANQFFVGGGSEELIRLLARVYVGKEDEAIMADITFPRYESNILIEGGTPVKVPLKDGVHNLDAMKEAITDKTKMIFVCNPNNPTGTIVGKEGLLDFINDVPSEILVVVDEAYYEYVKTDDYLQTVPLVADFPNLVILRTFSKIYGLAALRVGYGIMAPEIVQELNKAKDVFNVHHLAQVAATAAIQDQDFVKECSDKNAIEREYVQNQLQLLGISYFPSESNFIYVYCNQNISSRFLENGILVRHMKLPGYTEAFRITLGSREDNDLFLACIQKSIREKVV